MTGWDLLLVLSWGWENLSIFQAEFSNKWFFVYCEALILVFPLAISHWGHEFCLPASAQNPASTRPQKR